VTASISLLTGQSARVTVIVTTFNDAAYLPDALDSVVAQTRPANEVIVVDDGSRRDPSSRLKRYPFVTLIRRQNGGLAAARNSGLHAADGDFIVFLDADDRLMPEAIAAGLAAFESCPEAAFVYGAHRLVNARLEVIAKDNISAVGENPFRDLLTGNLVAMHAAVMYRKDVILKAGGFDESLRLCEDYELYLRLSRRNKVCWHHNTVAEYRMHSGNISRDYAKMLTATLAILRRYSDVSGKDAEAKSAGEENWRRYYDDRIMNSQRFRWMDRFRRNM
jgi:glycosyltransferase involved in cell wall biosynthesis